MPDPEEMTAVQMEAAGYRLVYQSGHTDTYCNGEDHIRTGGGFTRMSPPWVMNRYRCDCGRYRTTPRAQVQSLRRA
jgi:hypothetical protein